MGAVLNTDFGDKDTKIYCLKSSTLATHSTVLMETLKNLVNKIELKYLKKQRNIETWYVRQIFINF